MDVAQMLAELRQEREQIGEAILGLEQLARSREPEAGSPSAMTKISAKRRGRPLGSKNKAKPKSVSTPAFPEMAPVGFLTDGG
jgi:hypothetical protein